MADLSLLQRSLLALKIMGTHDGDIRVRFSAAFFQWGEIMARDLDEEHGRRLTDLQAAVREQPDPSEERASEFAKTFADLCEAAILKVMNDEREGARRR